MHIEGPKSLSSVLFVPFGSIVLLSDLQMAEFVAALEAVGYPILYSLTKLYITF
jgi:hypothetical protein